jgi:predicted RNA-binding Zn ribbon-like protein
MAYTPNPHHFVNGVPCLDFANTVVWRNAAAGRLDRLATAADLSAWAGAAGLARPRMSLADAVAMRETIDAYFRSGGDPREWAELVALYARALADPDARFACTVLHSALALAFSPAAKGVKICGNCGWLFLDRTRNGNKRWCTPTMCGSRTRSRRHYRRKTGRPD